MWHRNGRFYSASASVAMQTAVIAKGCLSVCLPVRPSATFQCFVQTNDDTIVQSSVSCRTDILVSGEIKFIRIFAATTILKSMKTYLNSSTHVFRYPYDHR